MKAIETAGLQAGRATCCWALDAASTEFYRDGNYGWKARARPSMPAAWSTSTRISSKRYPIVSIEDGMAEDDWEGWAAADRSARRQGPAGRRRSLRHQSRAPRPRASSAACGQRHPGQGQPDRHADRDAGRRRDGAPGGLSRRDVAPLGRDRGFDHRRSRGGDQAAARSRPARCRAPTAWPNTTSCCASRSSSAPMRATPGLAPSIEARSRNFPPARWSRRSNGTCRCSRSAFRG